MVATIEVEDERRDAPRPIDVSSGRSRLQYLDALRGVAILGVCAVHAGQFGGLMGYAAQVSSFGARGVQLFYMVSAFTLLTVSAHSRGLERFFVRRFFRIAPAFYVATVAALLFYGLAPRYFAPDGVGAHQIILTFLFLHGWVPDASNAIVPGGWSIGCEMMFYLAFPLLAGVVTTLPRAIAAFFLACAVSIATLYGLPRLLPPPVYLAKNFAYFSILGQAPVFMAGFVVFYLPKLGRIAALAASSAAIVMLGTMALVGDRASHFLLTIAPFALLIWGMASARFPLFDNAAIRALGVLSFSIYLCHVMIIESSSWYISSNVPALVGVGLLTSLAVAALSYRFIERPGIALGERFATLFIKPTGSARH